MSLGGSNGAGTGGSTGGGGAATGGATQIRMLSRAGFPVATTTTAARCTTLTEGVLV